MIKKIYTRTFGFCVSLSFSFLRLPELDPKESKSTRIGDQSRIPCVLRSPKGLLCPCTNAGRQLGICRWLYSTSFRHPTACHSRPCCTSRTVCDRPWNHHSSSTEGWQRAYRRCAPRHRSLCFWVCHYVCTSVRISPTSIYWAVLLPLCCLLVRAVRCCWCCESCPQMTS